MTIDEHVAAIIEHIGELSLDEQVGFLNDIRQKLHKAGPFKDEPVDYVLWTKADKVRGNDHNPNKVASMEYQLLEISINKSHFTQPIVSGFVPSGESEEVADEYIVIDGFHRHKVGKNNKRITKRLHGYLPIVDANEKRDKMLAELIAMMIQHNRARGKHEVALMAEVVEKMQLDGAANADIAKMLGMEAEELLRLNREGGIAAKFANEEFGRSWIHVGDDEQEAMDESR